jgi:hypothetical protein
MTEQFMIRVITGDGQPVEGACLRIVLAMSRKNNYTALMGSTDVSGELAVFPEELLAEFREVAHMALMDYVAITSGTAKGMSFEIPMSSDVARARDAYATFSSFCKYPPNYLKMLDSHESALAMHEHGSIHIAPQFDTSKLLNAMHRLG